MFVSPQDRSKLVLTLNETQFSLKILVFRFGAEVMADSGSERLQTRCPGEVMDPAALFPQEQHHRLYSLLTQPAFRPHHWTPLAIPPGPAAGLP